MISLDFLEKVEVFKGLNDDQLTAVQACCQENEFQRGDKIFGQGEEATQLFAVMGGQVELKFDMPRSKSDTVISSISETMAFGWSSLIPPHKMTLSGYCVSRVCKLATFEKDQLLQLFEKDTRLGYQVMSNLAGVVGGRFHKLQNEIARRRGEDMMSNW